MIRTGTYRYVRLDDVLDHLKAGWMEVPGLAGTCHGQYAVLMWRCDCCKTSSATDEAMKI